MVKTVFDTFGSYATTYADKIDTGEPETTP